MGEMDNPIAPLQKNNYLITKLSIVDPAGNPIQKPFVLQEGENTFRCVASYVDGSSSFYEPYWTCPLRYKTGGADLWGVHGRGRRASIVVRASAGAGSERFTEIACWVFPPDEDARNERIVDSTGFDYSVINGLPVDE